MLIASAVAGGGRPGALLLAAAASSDPSAQFLGYGDEEIAGLPQLVEVLVKTGSRDRRLPFGRRSSPEATQSMGKCLLQGLSRMVNLSLGFAASDLVQNLQHGRLPVSWPFSQCAIRLPSC